VTNTRRARRAGDGPGSVERPLSVRGRQRGDCTASAAGLGAPSAHRGVLGAGCAAEPRELARASGTLLSPRRAALRYCLMGARDDASLLTRHAIRSRRVTIGGDLTASVLSGDMSARAVGPRVLGMIGARYGCDFSQYVCRYDVNVSKALPPDSPYAAREAIGRKKTRGRSRVTSSA
jgi:hypothetical protein